MSGSGYWSSSMQKNAVLQSLDTNSCDPHSHEPREFCVGIVLHCTVLYCTVLYCTVLYCTVLHLEEDAE